MANQDDLQQQLQLGIDAVRRGDKPAARLLLRQVVEADPDNELAWMWLASAVENIASRRECLQQALRINPDNTRAREALERLGGQAPARRGRRQPVRPVATPGDAARTGPSTFTLLVGVIVVLAVIMALIFALVSIQQPTDPTREEILVALSPSVTPSPDSNAFTATPSPFMVIVTPDITLPPTFTPTFTPTASNTPRPSPTPFPLNDFAMIFTSIEEGQVVPDLYQAEGDGSEPTLLGADVRDVVYDPSGERVAFVRETSTTTGEGDAAEVVDAVELFVAPVDDLGAARQVTSFGATVSSPTWSPNGVELALVSDYDGDEDIWLVTDDGQNVIQLTENEAVDRDPAWSPDGNRIVYVSDQDSPGITKLFSMTPAGEDVQRLNDLSGNTYHPRWSHDGRRLVFVNDGSGDGDIYIADSQGQQTLLLTADDGGAEDREPVFTPDGQWVGFASNRESENFQLYLIDLRGAVLVRLTESDRDDLTLDYRPELLLRLRQG